MRSAVILAGGRARRLGEEKALLEFDGKPLICWTAEKLYQIVDEIVIVAQNRTHAERLEETISNFLNSAPIVEPEMRIKPQAAPEVAFTWDQVAGFGPVAGLLAGMEKARGNLVFATGCDLPFLNPEVIERLFELANEESYDAAVPVRPNGYFEPLHSVYRREKMLSACERALERSERGIFFPLQEIAVKRIPVAELRPIDPDLLSFFNLNTREDLGKARKLWPGCK
ncbi:MAG: molybdenum cofactor guanylyltransferase [Methanothrix sp.]|nr:molybdenum cofactor guanylyltransferase [Methanothrix sp.]